MVAFRNVAFFLFLLQLSFRPSLSTADLLTVVFDRIASDFKWTGVTRAVAPNISKAFDVVWHAGFLCKLKTSGISGQVFGFILSLSKEYPVNAGVPQGSTLGPKLILLYSNDLRDVTFNIYADDTTLCSKYGHESDLWQQLKLVSELESDLKGTVDWDKKWPVDFSAKKIQNKCLLLKKNNLTRC